MTTGLLTVPLRSPRLHAFGASLWAWLVVLWQRFSSYFTDRTPTFRAALYPMVALSCILYCRYPTTNYIFDEQEALLGNPYVNQVGFRYEDAIYRDFWGLPANASIGSYRPIPNFLWRGLVEVGERGQRVIDAHASPETKDWVQRKWFAPEPIPDLAEVMRRSWFQHLFNLFFHGVNGAIFTAMAWRISRRRMVAWFAGATFVTTALLTEAVSGVVGIADVMGGLGALLALAALALRAHAMPFAVFLAVLFGLFSKESAIVCIPLVPVAALLTAPALHPTRPARLVRGVLAGIGALAAFVLYVEVRKRWFPSPLPSDLHQIPELGAAVSQHASRDFLIWFHQAPLPKDPLNNPLVDAQPDLRFGGAMRVYFRGLIQVVFPWHLSGDYSSPQEPIPDNMVFPESILGWLCTVLPLGGALGLWVVALRREIVRREPLTEWSEAPLAEASPPKRGRIGRLVIRIRDGLRATRLGLWIGAHRTVLARAALELTLIVVSVWLTHKILGIGPSELNKDMGDKDPTRNIVIPPHILQDVLVYAALLCLAFGCYAESLWKPRSKGYGDYRLPVAAIGLVWLVVSYFPHSNIYVLLPTVRAERLWYFPVLGTTMLVTLGLVAAYDRLKRSRSWNHWAWAVPAAFLSFQAGRAYLHATDYRDDLTFWRETKDAVPHSAKAHLNYSVMAGARGMMEIRLQESHIARNLAPDWAMAHVYTGDTLCRMGRPDEAWPHYARGFQLGPNDKGLISLALQCLWDYKRMTVYETQLRALSDKHPGSWLAHLANDTLLNGDKQGGVQKEHKPRNYNQGAEEETKSETTEQQPTEETSVKPTEEVKPELEPQ